jgi:hypothetical protein
MFVYIVFACYDYDEGEVVLKVFTKPRKAVRLKMDCVAYAKTKPVYNYGKALSDIAKWADKHPGGNDNCFCDGYKVRKFECF